MYKWALLSLVIAGCQKSDDLYPDGSKATLFIRPVPAEEQATSESQNAAVIPSNVGAKDYVAEAAPLVTASPIVEPEQTETEEEMTAPDLVSDDGNTAGGIGTARVKEKTLTEELVPEEARKLTEGRRLPRSRQPFLSSACEI